MNQRRKPLSATFGKRSSIVSSSIPLMPFARMWRTHLSMSMFDFLRPGVDAKLPSVFTRSG